MTNRDFLFKSTIVLFTEQKVSAVKKKSPGIFCGYSSFWRFGLSLLIGCDDCCLSSGLRRVMREGDGSTLYSGAVTMVTNRKECWENYPDSWNRTSSLCFSCISLSLLSHGSPPNKYSSRRTRLHSKFIVISTVP